MNPEIKAEYPRYHALRKLREVHAESLRLDRSRDLAIRQALDAGLSERDIAAALGTSGPAINGWKKRKGWRAEERAKNTS